MKSVCNRRYNNRIGKVTKIVVAADCFQIISVSEFYYYF